MSQVVQLEAFEAQIRSKQICWFLMPEYPIAYPPGFQEQCFIESPPFQRRILLMAPSSSEAWKMVDKWDSVLVPSTNSDWSIILTLVLNQPPPCILLITPELRVPPIFFQKCKQLGQKSPTIVCFQVLTFPTPSAQITFDATFFPPSKKLEDTEIEATQAALQKLISSEELHKIGLKDAIRDLRSAGATLVVSSIEDPSPTLYWYYASIPKAEAKPLLASVVQTLLIRNR